MIPGRHISLESYRRNGTPVRTPVWFAEVDGVLYVYTLEKLGKVKRIRANPRVRVAPCDFFGKLRGAWRDAEAHIAAGEEERRGQEPLRQKYWPWKSIGNFYSRLLRRRQVILAIRLL